MNAPDIVDVSVSRSLSMVTMVGPTRLPANPCKDVLAVVYSVYFKIVISSSRAFKVLKKMGINV